MEHLIHTFCPCHPGIDDIALTLGLSAIGLRAAIRYALWRIRP